MSCARLVDQIAVAWRHKLTFLGCRVKPLGLERDVGVRDARGGPVGVSDQFAAVGRDYLGGQTEEHVARVADLDSRSLARFVEARRIFGHRKFSEMSIAVSAFLVFAALRAARRHLVLRRGP